MSGQPNLERLDKSFTTIWGRTEALIDLLPSLCADPTVRRRVREWASTARGGGFPPENTDVRVFNEAYEGAINRLISRLDAQYGAGE